MADITKVTPSFDTISAMRGVIISELFAGEALDAFAACYIDTDGSVKMAVSSVVDEIALTDDAGTPNNIVLEVSKFDGFTIKAIAAGMPLELLGQGCIIKLASGKTPSTKVYVSDTAGLVADAGTTAQGDQPVGKFISATEILVTR